MLVLPFTSVRQHDRGICFEARRDRSCDGPTDGRAVGDPRDLGVCAYAPRAAILRQFDHATSVDTTDLIERRPLRAQSARSLEAPTAREVMVNGADDV